MNITAHRDSGFTLIEMVMVIVLVAVLAGTLTPIINNAVTAYIDTQSRSDLVAKGRIALARVSRAVRYAVPNSVNRVDATTIEFISTRAGGLFIDRNSPITAVSCQPAQRFPMTPPYILNNGLCVMHPVDPLPFGAGDTLFIGHGASTPAELRGGATRVTIQAPITNPVANLWHLNFPNNTFPGISPGRHYSIIDGSHEIGLVGSAIHWNSASGYSASLYDDSVDVISAAPLLVDGVSALSFGVPTNGLLPVTLTLQDGDESIELYEAIYLRNTP